MRPTPDPEDLWRAYGSHLEVMLGNGPAFRSEVGQGWLIVESGAPSLDLNQAVIHGALGAAELDRLSDGLRSSGPKVLLGVSRHGTDATGPSRTPAEVAGRLADAGFVQLPEREFLFHATAIPAPVPGTFRIARVVDEAGVRAIVDVMFESHGYPTALVESAWGRPLLTGPDLGAWVAWAADEPAGIAFVTSRGGTLSLFDVLTLPRHRRRGAGRSVITYALHGMAAAAPEPISGTLFWSSPAGAPLYASLGFQPVDSVDVWVRGATPEELAADGAEAG